jgi:hypothetical protein
MFKYILIEEFLSVMSVSVCVMDRVDSILLGFFQQKRYFVAVVVTCSTVRVMGTA